MNECHRVLKPNAIFEIIVPIIGYTDNNGRGHMINSYHAWADPTHVSYFWIPESFNYFIDPSVNCDYNIKLWTAVSMEMGTFDARVILKKPVS
jgi:hypothetical protein